MKSQQNFDTLTTSLNSIETTDLIEDPNYCKIKKCNVRRPEKLDKNLHVRFDTIE